MRVVFDPNIFVSALVIPGGRADQALRRILNGEDQLVVSGSILREPLDVLARKFARDAEEVSRVAVFVADLGELVEPTTEVAVLSDQRDNRVLACAVDGGAAAIVTGDRDLLDLEQHRGVRMLTLRDYLEAG